MMMNGIQMGDKVTTTGTADAWPATESESTRTLSCTVCQQPLADEEATSWRGEPVHRDCIY